ncbi:MAG: AMIN domain-containing protein, partial [Pseudomonadota bacterium]
MRKATLMLAFLACALCGFAASASAEEPNGAPAAALTARIAQTGDANRIEIDFSERTAFRTFSLADPNRLVVDFPAVDWRVEPLRPGPDVALIDGLRFGARRGGARMVVDLR